MQTTDALTALEWRLPDRGRAGVLCMIASEAALFTIFVVAYVFYLGKSQHGPYPAEVLDLPVWATICLLASSITVTLGERALNESRMAPFRLWLGLTIALGGEFLRQTAIEWHRLIVDHHLTISTNLFGTTYYSLVGLHGAHVVIGLALLIITFLAGSGMRGQARRFELLAWYWHFVDCVWLVVLAVVYIGGR